MENKEKRIELLNKCQSNLDQLTQTPWHSMANLERALAHCNMIAYSGKMATMTAPKGLTPQQTRRAKQRVLKDADDRKI